MNRIEYLVISSSIDYSTDLVCYQLYKLEKKYYRLNRDELSKHKIVVDLEKRSMCISIENNNYFLAFDGLIGIYFRAPVFLRTNSKKELTVEEQLERNQWSSFLRNLIVFEKANWINHPVFTYQAENKLFQLKTAKECGLEIPKTLVTNTDDVYINADEMYVVKSLDTALFYDLKKEKEMFTYSNVIQGIELKEYDLSLAPFFVQELLEPKIDCRITFVGEKLFPVQIVKHQNGISGDWRKHKEELEYIQFKLPNDIEEALKSLMSRLGLIFGGIDLVYCDGSYYFIEVNPTGEWGWLEVKCGLNISLAIVEAMEGLQYD